jgi:hypothetical protein
MSYAYQWKRNGAAISGATANTYTQVTADIGAMITATVTATNAAGSASATAAAVGPVTTAAPVNSALPVITGSTVQGGVLTATTGTWTGSPSYAYQWKSAGTNVGTNANTYTTVVGDVGSTITVTVTATAPGGTANATSDPTATITAAVGGAIATPTLTSLTTATDTGASSTDLITNDTTPDLNVDWGADPPLTGDVIEVRNGGTLIVTHTVTAGEAGSGIVAVDFPLSAGSNSLTVTHKRGASSSSASSPLVVVIDTTAPTLSSATAVKTGTTTATLGVSTNETGGTLYGVLTLNSTLPTAAQIKAGQNAAGAAAAYAFNQAVSGTGAQSKSATGLTAGTTYYAYYMHEDVAGNQSTVPTGVSFTTDAEAGITWDTGRKGANITLSGGNLTAALSTNTFYANLFGNGSGKSSGKYYFEVTLTAVNLDGQGVGFGDGTVTTNELIGSQTTSVTWKFSNGEIRRANPLTTIYTAAAGDIVAVAVDFDAKLIWYRKKTGGTTNNWNNSGTANPATGVGGIDVTAGIGDPFTGPFWPMFTMEITGDNITANFGGSAYAMTAPSGFGNWS